MTVHIYGAGMAGLLTAQMLRRRNPIISEAKSALPNNHSALLRFRTDAVSKATAIPFRKVRVHKGIYHDGRITTEPRLDLSNRYSMKVIGSVVNRSINSLEPVDRFIAPFGFVETMAKGLAIAYQQALTDCAIQEYVLGNLPIISTIPLPSLLSMLPHDDPFLLSWRKDEWPVFSHRPIWTLKVRIVNPSTNVYQTIYYPSYPENIYRASITGDVLILEYCERPAEAVHKDIVTSLSHFGIEEKGLVLGPFEMRKSAFGKILPIDDDWRKRCIYHLTSTYGIYSIGRFATWRQILLDDVVHDIEQVDHFLNEDYGRKFHQI